MTVDGTDFMIREPIPFNPKWYTKKFHGPGLRYEVGICIQTGWICWLNGPYPCGEWPDIRISRDALIYCLRRGEKVCCDRGYRGSAFHLVPDDTAGRNPHKERMKSKARARHETINRKFKEYGCMKQKWRHRRKKHGMACKAVANLVQVKIRKESSTWNVAYNDRI